MKIFIDTADINEVIEANLLGVIDGVTTNPSLVAKTGKDFITVIKEIVAEVNGPISAEAVSLELDDLLLEARELAKIHENIVVKIPMTINGLKAVKTLTAESISTNVTLIFSAAQALLAAKAGATYVSPFVGRLDDISHDGMELVEQIIDIYDEYGYETEVIVASIRHPLHVVEAARMGADVATIPPAVVKQLTEHPLTDIGIKRFLDDWEKVPK
ncbi:MAG TPA: fructose-6-phosphate aldolase [Nitrospinota bacterium]|jgi:transaldolase|nr:fructose-6-phosphate aldolase [Nitrospinota bacterium]|tara:strand:- start:207829 stop:208473 length:645 start_codon:yes stop_codon:yes gene_type:complete